MKTTKLIIIILFLFLLGSCGEDFMESDSTDYLRQDRKDELLKNPIEKTKIIKAELEAVYATLREFRFSGNTSHDYFGLKAIHLATDLAGEDVVQLKHHHFGYDYRFDNRSAPYRRTRFMWALFYKMISSSNDFLTKYLEGDITDPKLLATKSEVLGIRGVAYYHLINYYQQTYKGNENADGVPLVLSSKDIENPRASVKEIYEQIITDLSFAVENGAYTVSTKDVDKNVAAAFLAKTYASMEKWDEAEKYAKIAVKGIDYAMPSNFFRYDNPDVLWGCSINTETTTLYASFFSHMDNTMTGYAGAIGAFKAIHNKLYKQIPESDARRNWFIKEGNYKPEKYNALPDYANVKFNSPSDFSGDYIYLRSADPYLLWVEALAEQGKVADATNALKDFLASRGSASEVDSHQGDLIEYVRLQRRIELWGEGTAFIDFKRWKKGAVRVLPETNHIAKIDVPAGNPKWTYQIPQREIEQNPNLTQNP